VPSQIQYIGSALSNFQGQKSSQSYLRWYWGYVDNAMRVIRRIWSLIQSTSPGLCYVNCVPSQMQCIYSLQFSRPKSIRTYLRCCWGYVDKSMRVILRNWSLIPNTLSGLPYVNSVPSQIQYICSAFSNLQGQKSCQMYLRCYWGYVDNAMRVIRRIWSLIQSTWRGWCYVNCVPSQIQYIRSAFSNFQGQKSSRTYLRC
jgi:hypothetical protein